MRETRLSSSKSGCSDASWRSSGERPGRENCPVVSVVISGGGAGDPHKPKSKAKPKRKTEDANQIAFRTLTQATKSKP